MRAVLILSVIIAAAVACPVKNNDCSISLPKICPSEWKIKTFESQCATLAFQGTWNVQMTTPIYIDDQNPLKTGLFCNSYPCTHNQLIFKDTTPCDDTDYNIEYEMIDSSYNLYTQNTEIQKALLCPAYGKSSPYAIFNVGCERYYKNPIVEQHPFFDDKLFRHKIGKDNCEREYTVAVIGADDCWKEYMVLAVMNQYKNFFGGNKYIIWVVTREVNPDWSTYKKAYDDIKASGLSPNYLVSVDHSIVPTSVPSLGVPSLTAPSLTAPSLTAPSLTAPSLTVPSLSPITTGDINDVVGQTSVSSTSSSTKSIVSDGSSFSSTSTSSSTTTTTTESTVIIEKSTEFTSLYQVAPCDLYNTYKGIQILKGLDNITIRKALSGRYFMQNAVPCSFYDYLDAKPGFLNTAFPSCSMEINFDDVSMEKWNFNTRYMVLERGYNMITSKVQQTRSYISSFYDEDNPFGFSVFALYTEGYYDKPVVEKNCLSIDGMICEQPSDIYNTQIVASIIGYKEDDYLIFCVANQYDNPLITNKEVPLVYSYTRDRIPSLTTMNSITQEILRCGINPNYMIKIDHSKTIDDLYTFDESYFKSTITSTSMTKSMVSTRGISIGNDSPITELPSICPKDWDVKTFDSQYATIAFQGTWNLQMATPTYINGNNPLKTGLFCNSYPCTNNQLIFKDTTPCDDTDYNTEYEMIDSSYNIYTQCTETQKALLCPAYGCSSPYAIFNVGSEKYYDTAITEKYPFIDKKLFRHKIGKGTCQREYTIAVIGADDCWEEYMTIVVINQYENFFSGNKYIIWVVTRDENPDWSTYKKVYEDIERSGLSPYYLVSVDHSIVPTSVPSLGVPSLTVPSLSPITTGDINDVVEHTSVSSTSSSTKSIVSDCSSSSSTSKSSSTTTTMKSTVIIEKSTEFTSLYQYAPCDLYQGIQILNGLDNISIRKAFSGVYFMQEATPCSYYGSKYSRVGFMNTAFPACSLQLCFDTVSMEKWNPKIPHMVMDRGYNMITSELQETRSYISSCYPEDHPLSTSVFAFYTEGYYDKPLVEKDCLPVDGMICKPPSDIYNTQIIASIIGYKEDDYLIFCVANDFNNPFFSTEKVYQVYAYTRDRIPSLDTMKSITQSLLYSGYNPNHMIKIDQSKTIDGDYVFDTSYFESHTSCWSSSSSSSSHSSSSSTHSSSSSSISITCD
ncbi:uncharacterized protein LOC111028766 [Myzus persicae]|uniref:uncharacterized protein LOC111028766 n=1 Tax=Myzus persicae TaxID=13164 RepID=UPI000B9319FD|nr:uncharacterized protein LOC111028766 [Myzus persicae]